MDGTKEVGQRLNFSQTSAGNVAEEKLRYRLVRKSACCRAARNSRLSKPVGREWCAVRKQFSAEFASGEQSHDRNIFGAGSSGTR